MQEMSFLKKISVISSIITKSPFFLALLIITILTIAVLIVNNKVKNKWVKVFTAGSYACIIAYIFITYGKSVLDLSDNLIDKVFNTIYFPNLITYICIILISILLFIRSLLDRSSSKIIKVSSISSFFIIMFLFVLILDTIVGAKIDITDKTAIYTNESLLALIQSTTFVFTIWGILLLIDMTVNIIMSRKEEKKKENKDKNDKKEINNKEQNPFKEEIKELSPDDFNKYFSNYNKTRKNEEIEKIMQK